jgi:hypothetical protein
MKMNLPYNSESIPGADPHSPWDCSRKARETQEGKGIAMARNFICCDICDNCWERKELWINDAHWTCECPECGMPLCLLDSDDAIHNRIKPKREVISPGLKKDLDLTIINTP